MPGRRTTEPPFGVGHLAWDSEAVGSRAGAALLATRGSDDGGRWTAADSTTGEITERRQQTFPDVGRQISSRLVAQHLNGLPGLEEVGLAALALGEVLGEAP